MHNEYFLYKASKACEVRTGIRFRKNLPYETLVRIFKGDEKNLTPFMLYLYSFFEE